MPVFTRENGFVQQSGLGYDDTMLSRLNYRFRLFMEPIAERFHGKRVLDVACHDGRWSFAALTCNAAHVTGIEYRQQLLDKSSHIIKPEMQDKVRFIQGDIFDALPKLLAAGERYDIVLCLGVYYHIMDHHRLLKLMDDFGPSLIIVDTVLVDSAEAFVRMRSEPSDSIRNAVPNAREATKLSTVGVISRGGVKLLARNFGFTLRYATLPPPNRRDPRELAGIRDYVTTDQAATRRYAFYLERKSGALPA